MSESLLVQVKLEFQGAMTASIALDAIEKVGSKPEVVCFFRNILMYRCSL